MSITVIAIYFSDIKIPPHQQTDQRKLPGNQDDARFGFPVEHGILSRFRSGSNSILGGLYPKKHRVVPHRCGTAESIAQLVKGLEILRAFDLVLRQPAYHLPTGHFALGAFLNDLAVFQFSKDAGDKLHRFRNCLVSIQLPRNAI